MRFSLILATIGRTEEVKNFLSSLVSQSYQSYELIVVDQNYDDRLVSIINYFKDKFPILHLRSTPGLSRARNVALKYISGDIVAFPDDDCLYPPETLERVANFFINHSAVDGLTGRPLDNSTQWHHQAGSVNRFNVWRRAISYTIFIRQPVVEQVGYFDESLGVGAGTPWGAGEEADYMLRILEAGFKVHYDPTLTVSHPGPIQVQKEDFTISLDKTYRYAMGYGRVLALRNFPWWFFTYQSVRPVVGAMLAIFQGRREKAIVHWKVFQGRVKGWRGVI